ncbi:MAG: helix-turn-helix domain-containing protein [Bacteroidota bacterium]
MVEKTEIGKKLLPVMDTMELLSGRWKIVIMTTLYIGGTMRFNEIKNSIPRITGRVLSKDLKFLESHTIVSRTIKDSSPITVVYALTDYGKTLDSVFKALTEWGINHRKKIIG